MLFNLSLRYKLPLWGSALIVVTALTLSASFMAQAWDDLQHDLQRSSQALGLTLARSLFPILLHDDLWRAYETVSAPMQLGAEPDATRPESIVVLDRERRVYVSTNPERHPVLTPLADLGSDYRDLDRALQPSAPAASFTWDNAGSPHLFVIVPVANDEVRLGTLIVSHEKMAPLPRFLGLAGRALLITLLVLAVLLPINWYWGGRMTRPLTLIAARMNRIGRGIPEPLDPALYPYRDELGEMFRAYGTMVDELRAKESLEKSMVHSERLAALGRLSAGVAHEINNPLAGMLTAVDTLKQRPDLDPRVLRTVDLIERGLAQIRDTVRALLVEAKASGRALTPSDIDDVRSLLHTQAERKSLRVDWHNGLHGQVALPANLVRQVLINLLLNAIQAALPGGHVGCVVEQSGDGLRLTVRNDGAPLTGEQLDHLFEPFMTGRESGHGLGLWVSYQIVQQLGGTISAANDAGQVQFEVRLPPEKPA